jgi:hypothetical protein
VRAQTVHNEAYKHLQLYRSAPLLQEVGGKKELSPLRYIVVPKSLYCRRL